MQQIMVDLPDPDGPHTTTRSFCATFIDTSRSTCIVPYHLLTWSSTMAGASGGNGRARRSAVWDWLMASLLAPRGAAELALQAATVFRHGKAEREIDHRQHDVYLGREGLP